MLFTRDTEPHRHDGRVHDGFEFSSAVSYALSRLKIDHIELKLKLSDLLDVFVYGIRKVYMLPSVTTVCFRL